MSLDDIGVSFEVSSLILSCFPLGSADSFDSEDDDEDEESSEYRSYKS